MTARADIAAGEAHEPLVVARERGEALKLTVGALVFVALSAWFLLMDPADLPSGDSPLYTRVMSLAGLLFFGACALMGGRYLLSFGPALVIDAEGVVDRASPARAGRIPWDEVKGFAKGSAGGARFLVIRLRDPERVIREDWPWMRPIHRYNLRRQGSPLGLPEPVLKGRLEDILARARALQGHYANGE